VLICVVNQHLLLQGKRWPDKDERVAKNNKNKISEGTAMDTFEQEMVPAVVQPLPELSLREVGAIADQAIARSAFVRYRERMAPDTIRRHRADIELFTEYLLEIPGLQGVGDLFHDPFAWSEMSQGLVEGFVQWQLANGYAIGSVNMRLSTVKLYSRLAQGAGALDENRAAMIRTVIGYRGREGRRIDSAREVVRVGAKKAETTWLTVEQARQLIAQPDTPQGRRDRVLMCLLLYHGLRCEEVQQLQVTSFNLTKGEFVFEQPKVGGELRHKMHMETYLAVRRYLELDRPTKALLMGSRKNGHLSGTMSKSAINQRVGTLGKQIGVEHLSPHDCRHFWANSAVEAGTDLEQLKQAGGWATLEMPSRYVKRRTIANERVRLGH
jgi:integrase